MHHFPFTAIGLAASALPAVASPVSAANLPDYSGARLFQRYCASCHGSQARGDGPVSKTLAVAPPDLTRISIRHCGAFPADWVYRVIDGREVFGVHGPRDIPVWGTELWREEGADALAGQKARDLISRLVEYLGGIQIVSATTGPDCKRH